MSDPRHRIFGAFPGDSVMQDSAIDYDFGGEIDKPHEELAERLGISKAAALRVLEWHAEQVAPTICAEVSVLLSRVLSILIQPQKNIMTVVWGLAFSVGIVSESDGTGSMAAMAERMRMHRATLSYWKRRWDTLLGKHGRLYGKSPATCERLREARMRVLAREASISTNQPSQDTEL